MNVAQKMQKSSSGNNATKKKQVNIVIIDIRILCQGIASNTSSLKDTTKFF